MVLQFAVALEYEFDLHFEIVSELLSHLWNSGTADGLTKSEVVLEFEGALEIRVCLGI